MDAEVTDFGWAEPPDAPTPAPEGKYHVRVEDLGDSLYGLVSSFGTHAGFVGNDPDTPWDDEDARATCMVLNSDFSHFSPSPQAPLDATTAHDLNHSIQFGYGALSGTNVPDDVFIEGGVTWMEDEVQDAADDNHLYLWPQFGESMGAYASSPYEYWIAFRGMTEQYGTGVSGGAEDVMQEFWERTSWNTGDNVSPMNSSLVTRGTTLADAFHAYAVEVEFNRPCGGGYVAPYCLEEGPGYVSIAGATSNIGVEDNYALNWVALPASAGPRFSARGLRPWRHRLLLAATDAAGNRATQRGVVFRVIR